MARKKTTGAKTEKRVTRHTYGELKEPRTPETGHTPLLPADEQVVALPMDNGWSKAVVVGCIPPERPFQDAVLNRWGREYGGASPLIPGVPARRTEGRSSRNLAVASAQNSAKDLV